METSLIVKKGKFGCIYKNDVSFQMKIFDLDCQLFAAIKWKTEII